MARRKQLKGIAGNLAQWCISRNFDNNGYWAIGQFFKSAEELNINTITINLKTNELEPLIKYNFDSSIHLLSSLLKKELKSKKIATYWLKDIKIALKFNEAYQHKYHYWGSALGKPFTCTVTITTDFDKIYTSTVGCNIWSHNPSKESCRNKF